VDTSVKLIYKLLAFSTLAVVLGLGSARYMVENGASFTTQQAGPWRFWYNEGRPDADPYTRARAARSGRLPVTASSALFLTALTDSDGRRLTSRCSYEIVARPLPAQWWNITVFNADGRLIPNKAERYAFNSENLTLPAGGAAYRIYLSSKARGGAWLPSGENNKLMLVMNIIRPQNLADASTGKLRPESLPEIRKTGCS
jgi:hypothetical protein